MIRLEQLRLDARLSIAELAEKAGVAHATVLRIESGKGAHVDTLGKLADALSVFSAVSPSELLRPAIWPDPAPTPAEAAA